MILIFAIHLLQYVRALANRRNDERRDLNEGDRLDQHGAMPKELSFQSDSAWSQRPPAPQSVCWQKRSIQTMAPVAAIDRIDLSDSRTVRGRDAPGNHKTSSTAE